MALTGESAARIPGARFIDPVVLARIDNLELIARTVVDGFISGLHRSPMMGLSLDFAEHRAYMPGDDLRRLDWRVFARTDRLYIKEYEADTNANFHVILDVSRSMDFGTRGFTKLDYARFLTASLMYLSNRQRDRVGLIAFAADIVDVIPPSAKHFTTVLHALDRLQPAAAGEFVLPLRKVADNLRRRAILVLISDLYETPDRIVNALSELRFRGHDLIVFHLLDPGELELSIDGASGFQDMETGETLAAVPAEVRDGYRELLQEHIATLRRRLGERGIAYVLTDVSQPLDHALFRYLSDRERLSRVR